MEEIFRIDNVRLLYSNEFTLCKTSQSVWLLALCNGFYGEKDNFTGEQFTLSFYGRNLKIYNNILRNIDIKNDKVILVLFGSAYAEFMSK